MEDQIQKDDKAIFVFLRQGSCKLIRCPVNQRNTRLLNCPFNDYKIVAF